MATDGTGLKVLIPQLQAAHNGDIELYRNREFTVFQCEADKSRDNVVSMFRDAEETQLVLALEGGQFIGAICGEEEKAQTLGLTGEPLLEHRRRFIRSIVKAFEGWMKAVEPTLLPSDPLTTATRYYNAHRDALFRFIDDPDVPIDNPPKEREFQNVEKLRLNRRFAGSTEGVPRLCLARDCGNMSYSWRSRASVRNLGFRAIGDPP
jgi:hypothetical protein